MGNIETKLFEKTNTEMAERVDLPNSLDMKNMCIDYANMVFKQYLIELSEGKQPQQSSSDCVLPVVVFSEAELKAAKDEAWSKGYCSGRIDGSAEVLNSL